MLAYDELRALLAAERLPAALVDLDAFDRNLEVVREVVGTRGTPVRVASKSLRVVALLDRLLDRGRGLIRGVMCFTAEEAEHLARHGFDDLLVAYPTAREGALAALARLAEAGVTARVAVDSLEGARLVSRAGEARGVRVPAVVCVDMSLELAGGRVHLGVRRSPLREPGEVVALARALELSPGARFAGLLGYEAQLAGLADANPAEPLARRAKRLMKYVSRGDVARRRVRLVEALRAAGLEPALVNGGGSGSLDSTTPESGVTEVAVGSAFLKPHLFDHYAAAYLKRLEPAAGFAVEVSRVPAPGVVTCLGGGYPASGAAGADRLPLPWLPPGLRLLPMEGAGEVQTPLRVPPGVRLELGEPVMFRHAKAGELAERFNEVLLVAGGRVVGRAKTYRGEGCAFL